MVALIIGGTASGKSEYAENLAAKLHGDKIYLATMKPYDEESFKKIDRHKDMRNGKGFLTREIAEDLINADFSGRDTVLLECISNLLANEMYRKKPKTSPTEYIISGLDKMINSCKNTVIVSNNIFCDHYEYKEIKDYIKALGDINAYLAEKADLVCEVVCGVPIIHKGSEIT